MSLGQEQEAFTADVVQLLLEAQKQGFAVRLGEVQRTVEQQQIYMKAGRSKTMNSMHIKKCAIDLILLKDGVICTREQIKPLGMFWEDLNEKNRWGGSWRGQIDAGKSSFVDAPHFERMV
jgi:hypothetical protein